VPHTLLDQEVELACLTYAERKQKISRDKHLARYEHVLALHRAGMGQRAIAREVQMSRRIVQRYLSSDGFPERALALDCGRLARASSIPIWGIFANVGTLERIQARGCLLRSRNGATPAQNPAQTCAW
jgi:DNA-binding phage protein